MMPLTVVQVHNTYCLQSLLRGTRGLQFGSLTAATRTSLLAKVLILFCRVTHWQTRSILRSIITVSYNKVQRGNSSVDLRKAITNHIDLFIFRTSKGWNLRPSTCGLIWKLLGKSSHHILSILRSQQGSGIDGLCISYALDDHISLNCVVEPTSLQLHSIDLSSIAGCLVDTTDVPVWWMYVRLSVRWDTTSQVIKLILFTLRDQGSHLSQSRSTTTFITLDAQTLSQTYLRCHSNNWEEPKTYTGLYSVARHRLHILSWFPVWADVSVIQFTFGLSPYPAQWRNWKQRWKRVTLRSTPSRG